MFWHWQNDPQGLPDDDHTRCIAAPGVRHLLYCGRLFEMTTVACSRVPPSASAPVFGRRTLLQMEHVSNDSAHGLVARSGAASRSTVSRSAAWRSMPPASTSLRRSPPTSPGPETQRRLA